jgi:hypothetical protein
MEVFQIELRMRRFIEFGGAIVASVAGKLLNHHLHMLKWKSGLTSRKEKEKLLLRRRLLKF